MEKTINITINKTLEVHVADTFKRRFLGYMFQREPKHESLLIQPCNSVHTFFMHFPIDVLFLNAEKVIIKRELSLQPGKVIFPVKGAKMVLEAAAGTFEDYHVDERLEIK
ncbi:DUF192 domain-containing protein [Isachenkonia alkalipeptolytica]|uniref:DUF192 domain-containing protein n=1 Tax=Isachenkonia alkalipeptolytica TaxID=2565777 RepID=A0AA44BDI2_9CLOT|nr:DUF192 domain-containing protein [Isachenkonia alkalipeptolytica]NBG87943.1 DUF192 domain-containing protein [Isachenkonia alkalipeptolytica]